MEFLLLSWLSQPRVAERSAAGLLAHEPPRNTRVVQVSEGSAAFAEYCGCQQSAIHSHTLPCMSKSPSVLGLSEPAGAVAANPSLQLLAVPAVSEAFPYWQSSVPSSPNE